MTLDRYRRLLSLDFNTKGFGFVVLEGNDHLIDWGLRDIRENRERATTEKVDDLLRRYSPAVVVVEDVDDPASRRGARIEKMIRKVIGHAKKQDVRVETISTAKVRGAFARQGATTKHRIASVIVARFPELAPYRPPIRKIWMSVDQRQAVFDAAAMAYVTSLE